MASKLLKNNVKEREISQSSGYGQRTTTASQWVSSELLAPFMQLEATAVKTDGCLCSAQAFSQK